MNTYEALFIFGTQLKDDELSAATERVTEDITSRGGIVTATDTIGKRTFARQMQKRDGGYYVRLHVEMEPSLVDTLLGRYRLNDDVFRVQIVSVTPKVEEAEAKEDAPVAEEAVPAAVEETAS